MPGKETQYPKYMMLGRSQGRSGRVQKISSHQDSIPGQSNPQEVEFIITVLVLKYKWLRRPEHLPRFREKKNYTYCQQIFEGGFSFTTKMWRENNIVNSLYDKVQLENMMYIVRIVTEGGMQAEGDREYDAEENIWAYEGRGNRGVEKTTQRRAL